jgi:putative FmdB family regulatory protein
MPIYEYKCSKCNEDFEIKQSFNDKPVTVCHRCGSEARRVFRPAPIIFKGSGFYVTDHAKDSEKKSETRKNGHKSPPASIAGDTPKSDTGTAETKTDSSSPAKKEGSAS